MCDQVDHRAVECGDLGRGQVWDSQRQGKIMNSELDVISLVIF